MLFRSELPRGFRESVERCRRPQEDTLQPYGKGFDGFRCCAGLGVNFDNMGSIPRSVVFGETGHRTLLQVFDPLDFSLKAVADIDGKTRIFSVEDISFGAPLEGVGVGFDEVFESVDSGVELSYLGGMIVLPLFDRFK